MDPAFLPQVREFSERNYARLEATIDRLLNELIYRSETGPVERAFAGMTSRLDQFEQRMTQRFFWYFMTQGIANAIIILGMLKMLR